VTTHTTNQASATAPGTERATATTDPPTAMADVEDDATINGAPTESGDDPADPPAAAEYEESTAQPGDLESTAPPRSVNARRQLRPRWSMSPHRAALLFGLAALTAVAALWGWLVTAYHHQQVEDQQYAAYLQTARQGALNLTTIDWQHADTDIARILDSSAGQFHDDFSARAQAFLAVVKQTQSRTEGAVVDAGIEAETLTGAQVLVAVNVKSTQGDQPEQRSRGWRMRIVVQRDGDSTKIANVEFVP